MLKGGKGIDMFEKFKNGFDTFVGYPHWQNIGVIIAIPAVLYGYTVLNPDITDDENSQVEQKSCDKPFVYVKGSVSFDRDAIKPEDISTLKIAFKGDTEECSYDISIEDNLSYFVKTEKCKGGEKIKFSISNDGYKIGSNSVVSSTCKISPIRIY